MKKTEGRKSRDNVPLKATILRTGGLDVNTGFSDLKDNAKTRRQNGHCG
jgi:hypothetical protein